MDEFDPMLQLALALSLGATDIARWLGDRLERSVDDGAFGRWQSFATGFVLGLFCRGTGAREAPAVEWSAGIEGDDPYGAVWRAWGDPDRLSQAIQNICDFHLERTDQDSEEFIGEFTRPAFSTLPVEVWALQSTRSTLGLGTPSVAHPLLSGPFARAPASVSEIQDELLTSLSQRALSE